MQGIVYLCAIGTGSMGTEVPRGVTSRGRLGVRGIELGRTGEDGLGYLASSHRAQYGLWMRPANGVGALEYCRRGGTGEGSC